MAHLAVAAGGVLLGVLGGMVVAALGPPGGGGRSDAKDAAGVVLFVVLAALAADVLLGWDGFAKWTIGALVVSAITFSCLSVCGRGSR